MIHNLLKISLALIFLIISTDFISKEEDPFESYIQEIEGSDVSFKMIAIPAGEFSMGSPENEDGRSDDEGPQKKVKIKAFWMEEHEVTHDEFNLFLFKSSTESSEVDGVSRPTPQYVDLSWGMGKEGGYPANSMSQHAALMYCKWLYKKTGHFYRLPTEAEWEYAARAGEQTAYYFGDNAEEAADYAWYSKNSDEKYHKVKQLKPNGWGLYDMAGNLAEWTIDQYDEDFLETVEDGSINPSNPIQKRYPISLRGGHFESNAEGVRSASRMASNKQWNMRDPQTPKSKWWLTDAAYAGFRVIRPLEQPSKEEIENFYDKHLN